MDKNKDVMKLKGHYKIFIPRYSVLKIVVVVYENSNSESYPTSTRKKLRTAGNFMGNMV